MIIRQFRTLATYHRHMNQQFYAACATLSDAERKQDRSAFFKSIHGTLNHMLLTDRLWLDGFTGNSVAYGALDEELYADFDELRREREQTDAAIGDWVETLTEARLAEPFNEHLTHPLWFTLTHFFNHQTHHRGQLSAMLSQAGADYGTTDMPWIESIAAVANAD